MLVDVRRKGYALDEGESYEGICAVGAPVFDFARDVVGALSITVVGARLGRDEVARLVGPLRQSAEAFSTRLGALAPVEGES